MDKFKLVFAGALAVILVVSALTALFGAGRVVNATLRTYVLKVEECRHDYPRRVPLEGADEEYEEPKEECFIDYNATKRDIANGVGMVIVATPLAWFMYRNTRKMIEERKEE